MHVYLIKDDQPDQDTNEGLSFIGRIYLEDHMNCSDLFEIARQSGCDIHPFEDTRLRSNQVIQLSRIFTDYKDMVPAVNHESFDRISKILGTAISEGQGILSFSD